MLTSIYIYIYKWQSEINDTTIQSVSDHRLMPSKSHFNYPRLEDVTEKERETH